MYRKCWFDGRWSRDWSGRTQSPEFLPGAEGPHSLSARSTITIAGTLWIAAIALPDKWKMAKRTSIYNQLPGGVVTGRDGNFGPRCSF